MRLKAAEDLSITQPSLSAAVKKVEEVLGERLFERTSRHVSLTPAGQRAEDAAELASFLTQLHRGSPRDRRFEI